MLFRLFVRLYIKIWISSVSSFCVLKIGSFVFSLYFIDVDRDDNADADLNDITENVDADVNEISDNADVCITTNSNDVNDDLNDKRENFDKVVIADRPHINAGSISINQTGSNYINRTLDMAINPPFTPLRSNSTIQTARLQYPITSVRVHTANGYSFLRYFPCTFD